MNEEENAKYRIEVYSDMNAKYPRYRSYAQTDREARKIAAKNLGHKTLRGSYTWLNGRTGQCWQFGKHTEDKAVAIIFDIGMERQCEREEREFG